MTALFWQPPLPPPVTKCGECPHVFILYVGGYCNKATGGRLVRTFFENQNGITETCPKWQEQNKEVK